MIPMLIVYKVSLKALTSIIASSKVQIVGMNLQSHRFSKLQIKKFEDSVFSGNYCTGDVTQKYLKSLENSRIDTKRNG